MIYKSVKKLHISVCLFRYDDILLGELCSRQNKIISEVEKRNLCVERYYAHLAFYVLESDISCMMYDRCSRTCTKSPSFASIKEPISAFVATDTGSSENHE